MNFVELHCHLDGSLSVPDAWALAKEEGLIPAETPLEAFAETMRLPAGNQDLYTYLERFSVPLRLLQTAPHIRRLTASCIGGLAADGVVYAELRFAPQLQTQGGLCQQEVVEATLAGVEDAAARWPDTHVGLLLCQMVASPRLSNWEANLETVRLAAQYLGRGVVGLDIAGPEGASPLADYAEAFRLAGTLGVPYTIHAGEAGPAANVKAALALGARRIGHGGHCLEDEAVLAEVIESGAALEMCVTSNLHCHNQPSAREHALRPLFDAGVRVTFNTDNRTVSGTTMQREAELLETAMRFTRAELRCMQRTAVEASFASEAEKARLRALV